MSITEKTLKLNKREIEIIKDALDNMKFIVRVRVSSDNQSRREQAINELYNIEAIENKVKGLK